MYSLNVPIPGAVSSLATNLAREWPTATARTRRNQTLVLKRLGQGPAVTFDHLRAKAREVLAGTAPFAVRVQGIDQFSTVPDGPAPVVYLAVESQELFALHKRLVAAFDPVDDIEGPNYEPHVTIARGGDPAVARRLTQREIDPIEWTVDELEFYDARREERAGRLSLPMR